MAKKTNTGLVEFCKQCLAAKLGYVYSAFGRVCTKSLLNDAASRYPANNLAGGEMRRVGEKWLGRRVVDCSGMIKYYLMADKFGDDPNYTNAIDTAVHISKASKQGSIKTLPEVPGTLLWMPGHVGVYIGNGQVIESKGTAYGVVQTKLSGRGWQKWFWIKEIDYSGKPETVPLSLDTSEYTFKEVGQVYQFLARGTEKPQVSSSNPDIISVKFNGQDSRGYLFEIKALKPGLSTITAKTSTKTAGFRASIGCQLDTHGVYKCRVGQQYTFLSRSVKAPDIKLSDINMVTVNYAGRDSRGHLFTLKAKNLGQTEITASLGDFKDSFMVEVSQ